MAEYIERQKAIFPLYQWKNIIKNTHGENDEYVRCLTEAIEIIEDVPAADVQPVRHGRWGHRWICSNMSGYEYACSCSVCGNPTYRISTLEAMPPYCQNCGAKMDGGEE